MNTAQSSFPLASGGYAPYLVGSIVLLGIVIMIVLHGVTTGVASKISVDDQQEQEPPAGDPIANTGETQVAKDPAQKLYGLVIGINDYPSLGLLRGAVADANDMTNFLTDDLHIPPDHIINLRNKEATREAIIQAFVALQKDTRIQPGDPILIYYAGHGGLAKADQDWKDRYGADKIQVIFPYDYQLKDPESSNPVDVNCIPDKTIARLLNQLAEEKGDNITVIFDSCHSASGSRDNESDRKAINVDRRARTAEVELEIPHDIDDDIFEVAEPPGRQRRDAELLLNVDQTSHIHLAACGVRQKAFEENGQGVFTAAILKKFRESRVDSITYHNLTKSLEMTSDDQSPQCYGKHKNRKLFNSRISSRNVHFIPVNFKKGVFALEAGDASGVTPGSIWQLHKSPTEGSPSVGKFRVKDLCGSEATLEATESIDSLLVGDGNRWFAQCTQIGPGNELKVWISLDDRKLLFQDASHMGGAHESGIGYIITPTADEADVRLEIRHPDPAMRTLQPHVVFHWCDNLAKKYGASELKHKKSTSRREVETVLFAAAKWRWHLQRGNSVGRLLERGVTMDMLKVGNRVNRRRTFLPKPEPVRINGDEVVDFTVESSTLHGFKLNSKVPRPLYVRMFYFDATDFSIGDMFGHNVAYGEDTPNVVANGSLLIGDGADGGTPIKFNIAPGNEVEMGYMKVFWSTEPLELDHVAQKSAFEMKPGEFMRGAEVCEDDTDSEWGTTCLTLVLRESGLS